MKKVELVESVAEKAGLTKADATRAIDAFVETISETLAKGDKVPVAGFGTLKLEKLFHLKQVLHLKMQ